MRASATNLSKASARTAGAFLLRHWATSMSWTRKAGIRARRSLLWCASLPPGLVMHKLFIALVVSALAVGSATADVQADVMSVVRQWADGFNKSDVKSIKASCADQASVVDDFPPHEWHGAGACSKWFDDFQTFASKQKSLLPSLPSARLGTLTSLAKSPMSSLRRLLYIRKRESRPSLSGLLRWSCTNGLLIGA